MTLDNGFFEFNGVSPATPVRVQVSASELKNWTSSEITLQPGQFFILTDVTLAVAPVETSVSAVTSEQVAAEQIKVQEQQRVLGVIPNFYVTYEKKPAPLTAKLKFKLAMKALTDPVTITGLGMNAAMYQAADYPSYRPGWTAFMDSVSAQRLRAGIARYCSAMRCYLSLFRQRPTLLLSRYRHSEIASSTRLVHSIYHARR